MRSSKRTHKSTKTLLHCIITVNGSTWAQKKVQNNGEAIKWAAKTKALFWENHTSLPGVPSPQVLLSIQEVAK